MWTYISQLTQHIHHSIDGLLYLIFLLFLINLKSVSTQYSKSIGTNTFSQGKIMQQYFYHSQTSGSPTPCSFQQFIDSVKEGGWHNTTDSSSSNPLFLHNNTMWHTFVARANLVPCVSVVEGCLSLESYFGGYPFKYLQVLMWGALISCFICVLCDLIDRKKFKSCYGECGERGRGWEWR